MIPMWNAKRYVAHVLGEFFSKYSCPKMPRERLVERKMCFSFRHALVLGLKSIIKFGEFFTK